MANIVQAPDIQNNIINDLIGSMAAAGMTETPKLPGAIEGQAPPAKPKLLGSTENSPIIKTANDAVTKAIGNTGQLIPMQGQSSSNDNSLGEIKQLISQISGNQTPQAAPEKSSGGGGGLGDIIGTAMDIASFIAWIICTELVRQKRLNVRWYYAGAKKFAAYPATVKEGYFLWAVPCVYHLRNHPHSWFSRFLEIIFNWRAENIAAYAGIKGARKIKKGAVVTAILWPICFVLGCVVITFKWCRNPMQVYARVK